MLLARDSTTQVVETFSSTHDDGTEMTLGNLGTWGVLGALILGNPTVARAEKFAAPSGPLGAGLSTDPDQILRVYGEMSLFGRSDELGPFVRRWSAFPIVLGGGIKVSDNLELEGQLPIAIGRAQLDPVGFDEGGVTLGNVQIGANFFHGWESARLKLGGAIAWGPWTDSEGDSPTSLSLSHLVRLDEGNLWERETINVSLPMRFEYDAMPKLALTADAKLIGQIPTGGTNAAAALVPSTTGDPEITLNLAPGIAYVGDVLVAGARMPLWWLLTEGGDNAQLAVEPFVRVDLDSMFINSRFTLNLDNPWGFSFDTGGVWALHLGVGFYL